MKKTQISAFRFTLIELLVVVGIIAILASILLPALQHAAATARFTACTNNIRQSQMALLGYADINDNYMMPTCHKLPTAPSTFNGIPTLWGGYVPWQAYLLPEVGSRDIFMCPENARWPSSAYESNGDTVGPLWWGHYGLNNLLHFSCIPNIYAWPNLNTVADPADRFAIMDNGCYFQDWKYPQDCGFGVYYIPGQVPYNNNGTVSEETVHDAENGRHPSGKINIAYYDGHVGRMKGQDVYDLAVRHTDADGELFWGPRWPQDRWIYQ